MPVRLDSTPARPGAPLSSYGYATYSAWRFR